MKLKRKASINDIEKAYCSYPVCKLLQEIDFDVFCNDVYVEYLQTTEYYQKGIKFEDESCLKGTNTIHKMYNNSYYQIVSAPTQDIAIEWLRLNYEIHISIDNESMKRGLCNYVVLWHNEICFNEARGKGYKTPKDAKDAGLLYALTFL